MFEKKSTIFLVAIFAFILVVAAVFLGSRLYNGDSSLLRNVEVDKEEITPNADGDNDATHIAYELSRNADVSIYLENEVGTDSISVKINRAERVNIVSCLVGLSMGTVCQMKR